MAENLVAALDIGTTKIVAVVGEADAHGNFYVIGHGEAPADGLRRGVVVDMEKAAAAIRKAVDDAQMVSGTEIDRLTVGIAGEHIRAITSTGVIGLNRSDAEITAADVNKAIEAARTVSLPVDREIIHVIPQWYSVDNQEGIRDPIGMTGSRLEVEVNIVTASVTTAQNIYRAIERCRLEVDHIVLESVALSTVLLGPADTKSGAILVDIGGEITNITAIRDGAICYTGAVVLGGRNVTNDIAIGLRTQPDKAEALKLNHGAAMASLVDAEELIHVPTAGSRGGKDISRNVLATIIEPRMEEIFSMVARELKRSGISGASIGNLILTGGGAAMPGTVELAEQLFDLPARVGHISGVEHIPEEFNSPRYATVIGLLVYGFTNEPLRAGNSGSLKRIMRKLEHWIARQF